jgi:protein-tyrosine-phosphatase
VSAVRRVLFVCTANICRSAYAEVVTAHRLGSLAGAGVELASAGTHGWLDHPMDEEMAAQAVRRGADPSRFRSRRLTRAIIDEADLVLTAEAAHRAYVLRERPAAVRRTFSLGQLAAALDRVDPAATGSELLVAARRARATARPEDDVADPFRRGADAAEAAAVHLDDLLETVLPRLLPSGK